MFTDTPAPLHMPYSCCLLHTPTLTIHYNPEQQSLLNQWRGHQSIAQIQEHAQLIQSCLQAHRCRRILSDHSGLRSPWTTLAPWVAQRLSSHYAALGVRSFAWVPASGTMESRATMEIVCQLVERPVIALFPDITRAAEWLRQH